MPTAAATGAALVEPDLVELEGGEFTMGTDGEYGYLQDGEGPAHQVVLSPFAISRHAVTNRSFAAFVAATGHRTEAERYGASFVFFGFLAADAAPSRPVRRRPRLLRLVGNPAAERGGVGVRGPRRARQLPLPLGRGAGAGRRAPDERLAGGVPH